MPVRQLDFLWNQFARFTRRADDSPVEASGEFTVLYRRNPLAKRYRLYLDAAGQPRVTIPRRGTLKDARVFAANHRAWILAQLEKRRARREAGKHWSSGTEVLFRGERHPLRFEAIGEQRFVHLATERIPLESAVEQGTPAVRIAIESQLRALAENELPGRVRELSSALRCAGVVRVSIRNQRSRWGSCSRRGTVSLNWRLIQLPAFVRDYIIIHELMHLREMNHSARFWKHVEEACPNYREAELWLKTNPGLLTRVD